MSRVADSLADRYPVDRSRLVVVVAAVEEPTRTAAKRRSQWASEILENRRLVTDAISAADQRRLH